MKLAKIILLSSVTALLFANNAYSAQEKKLSSLAKTEISSLLSLSREALQPVETKQQIAKQIEMQLLELQTQDLVESATSQLPKNRFKVVIAD